MIVDSAVTDTGLMGKTKEAASLAPSKRETPYCCVLCLRPIKGPSSLRRHLLTAHRDVVLIEWGAVAGYHGATAHQVRILVEGVPEDDALYADTRKRFGGNKGVQCSQARQAPPPRRPRVPMISTASSGEASMPDSSVRSPTSPVARTVGADRSKSTAGPMIVAARSPGIIRDQSKVSSTIRRLTTVSLPLVPQLLSGCGPTLAKILHAITQGIEAFQGPEEADALDDDLDNTMPEVDRALRGALTLACLKSCRDTAFVGECLIVGAERRMRHVVCCQAPSTDLCRSGREAEERFDRLAAGFGYAVACSSSGTRTAKGLLGLSSTRGVYSQIASVEPRHPS